MGTKVKVLEYGEQVEMVFQSANVLNTSEDHPMHLHGHSFYMVGAGGGNFDCDEDPKTYNLVDPPYVNTATLPRDGWLAVRFYATNPRVWLWHSHLERHYSWGMKTVLIVKKGGTPETTMREPPLNMPVCEPPPIIEPIKSKYSPKKQKTKICFSVKCTVVHLILCSRLNSLFISSKKCNVDLCLLGHNKPKQQATRQSQKSQNIFDFIIN
ncbi:hypothetical protein SLE2022_329030 [Rubroshorea leprosula]